MYTFFAFISIFGGVVFIHELGHFLAARSVGVKVDKFYVGFDFFGLGLKLFKDKKGTEYGLGLFPFGGYCKIHGMVDESLDNPDNEALVDPTAFESKNTFEKLWILSAGVIMNFILAIAISFFIFSFYGKQDQLPVIHKVDINGPSYNILQSNSEIISINNNLISSWSELISELNFSNITNVIDGKNLEIVKIGYIDLNTNKKYQVEIKPRLLEVDFYYPLFHQMKKLNAIEYVVDSSRKMAFIDIGVEPLPQAYLLPYVDEVLENSPAAVSGLPPKSLILKINDVPINSWDELTSYLSNSTYETINIVYEFENKINSLNITPIDGKIGIKPSIDKMKIMTENIIFTNLSFTQALKSSFLKPIEDLSLQFWGFSQIINGSMGFDGLGGPVKITQEAGKAARYGMPYFLGFMATISTILGFMNILPIPGLDGGHAFMTIIEGVSRKKIPINIKMTIQSIAVFFLLGLTLIILLNDLRNLF